MLDRLLRFLAADMQGWIIWLILTLVLIAPAYFMLKRFGIGGDEPEPADRQSNGDALDRIVAGTEEIPEALPAGSRTRR
jgi:hypothetical protein